MQYVVAGIGQAAKDTIIIVDKYPEYGLKKRAIDIKIDGGGPVATALYTLSKLGIRCRISTVVGDDSDGRYIIKNLKEAGIDTRFIIKREDSVSHTAFIVVEKSTGERTIFYRLCNGNPIKPDELSKKFFHNISFLHLDGFQKEISIFAARYARKNNIPVMLDAGSNREYMKEIIKYTDYLVASSVFASEYGFNGTLKSFKELSRYFNCSHLTVTMGAKGSFTFHSNEIFYTPAMKIKAVDTTGAGDVFHGALIYAILKKYKIRKAIRFASDVAALKCRDYGGRKGICLKKDLLKT